MKEISNDLNSLGTFRLNLTGDSFVSGSGARESYNQTRDLQSSCHLMLLAALAEFATLQGFQTMVK